MICFIHGLGATKNCFTYLAQELGLPYMTATYDSSAGLHRSIAEVTMQLPTEELVLVGHSMGGLISAHIALGGQRQVEKLVTISSPLGGSRAARFLRFMMPTFPVMHDLTPTSPYIKVLQARQVQCPVLSIISVSGGFPILGGANDGTVEVSSQKALTYASHVEINANHFEVLLKRKTVTAIKGFL